MLYSGSVALKVAVQLAEEDAEDAGSIRLASCSGVVAGDWVNALGMLGFCDSPRS